MNRFKFWKSGRLRRLGRIGYIALFTAVWTIANIGMGIYREKTVLEWTWNEIMTFQSQMILFVIISGATIGWFTWDLGDESELNTGIDNHILDTDRLILRKMNQTDFKTLHAMFSDTKTVKGCFKPFTKDDTRSWILKSMESYAKKGFGHYVVVRKKDGKIIGDVGLMMASVNGLQEVDFSYIIRADYRRKGYGIEAARACLEYAIYELKIQRIVTHMPVGNTGGQAVAIQLGMQSTGIYNGGAGNTPTDLYVLDQRMNY